MSTGEGTVTIPGTREGGEQCSVGMDSEAY